MERKITAKWQTFGEELIWATVQGLGVAHRSGLLESGVKIPGFLRSHKVSKVHQRAEGESFIEV